MERRFSGAMGEGYEDEMLLRVFSHHNALYDCWVREMAQRLLVAFPDTGSFHVIEGGCGTGLSTARLLAAPLRLELVSLDNEPLMIKKAKARFFNSGIGVTVATCDVLTFLEAQDDNSVHAFMTAFLLHNTEPDYRSRLTRQVFRVLKPGGIFLNADRCGRADQVEYFVALAAQIQSLSGYLALGRPDQYLLWFEHFIRDEGRRFKEDDQQRLLEDAGFVSIEIIERLHTECLFGASKPE